MYISRLSLELGEELRVLLLHLGDLSAQLLTTVEQTMLYYITICYRILRDSIDNLLYDTRLC